MAIQRLRDSSEGMIAKIIVGLIIVIFALFGFGQITTFLAPTPKVATVNGDDISQQDMEIAVERNRRLLQAQGKADVDEDELRADVLQNLINRKLLSQAASDLGLYFGDASIDKEIVSTPVFQVDGVFNADQFQNVIRGAGYSPVTYRADMRIDKELQQMAMGIQATAFLTESEARRTNALAQQKRDIAWLRVNVDALMDDVNVSEDEIKDYYASHQADFMTPETVDLSYIEVDRDKLMEQVPVTEDELKQHYDVMKDTFAQKEERRVAHILVEVNDDVTDEQAKAKIEDILARVKKGESFSDLAKEFSDDPGSASEGGDLGFNPPGTFVPEFEEAADALKLNQMSGPVKTQFGYHLIKLLGIEPAKIPSFAEVRDRVERDYREGKAEDRFVELSGRLSELAFESPDLQEPAKELGLQIEHTGPVTRDASEGLAANDDVMAAAFSTDVLVDGNNSKLIEIDPNHHVVIHVDAHVPQQLKPLETVADQVKQDLAHEKATALAESRAQEMVKMLEEGSITRFVADKYNLEWQVVPGAARNQPGLDREIGSEAFKLPRPASGGKSVGYAVLDSGDAVVLSVTNVVNPPEDKMDPEQLKGLQRLLANRQGASEFQEFRDYLIEEGDVTRK